MGPSEAGSPRRLFLSVAVICFTAGFVGAAYSLTSEEAPGTAAGILFINTVDLRLEGGNAVGAFIGNPNFAPGDVSRGKLTLTTNAILPEGLYDLDIDVRSELQGARPGALKLDEALFVTKLRYGDDDLLSGGKENRNLLREIDGNPLLGNGDGHLTVAELRAGINDLPPPRAATRGTVFDVEVRIGGPGTSRESLETLSGQQLRLTFVFQLGDAAEADLN